MTKTKIHCFRFDISKPADREAWEELRDMLAVTNGPCFEAFGKYYYPEHNGKTLDLSTRSIFDNQWNSIGPDLRVFDWALEVCQNTRKARRGII